MNFFCKITFAVTIFNGLHKLTINSENTVYLIALVNAHFSEAGLIETKTIQQNFVTFYSWEREGIEGIVYDHGLDKGEDINTLSHIGVTEIMDALQLKYDLLRKKLFWEMIKMSKGNFVLL
jgi:hypothetical protein